MSLTVDMATAAKYIIVLKEPEISWIEILAGRLRCNEQTVVSMVMAQGLIELMSKFNEPVIVQDNDGT